MAKRQKYSEDLLLEAVIKFAEVEKKKIKATELAKWARTNMEGLEEVQSYHFIRSVRERDLKTGKAIERPKVCTKRIEEINKARNIVSDVNSNCLIRASNIDAFFNLPLSAQRKAVVETRKSFDELIKKNVSLDRENESLRIENKAIKTELGHLAEKISLYEKSQRILSKQVSYIMKATDESERKNMLAAMGVEDGSIDLDVYFKSLQQDLPNIMNIDKILKNYKSETSPKPDNGEDIKNTVLYGIDF